MEILQGKSTFVMSSTQCRVFKTIVIPYLYKRTITINFNEEFVHCFAIAKYLQLRDMLKELKYNKNNFMAFGRLWYLPNTDLTCPVFDFFESGGLVMQKCLQKNNVCGTLICIS